MTGDLVNRLAAEGDRLDLELGLDLNLSWRPLGEIAAAVAAKARLEAEQPQPGKEVARPVPQGA